MYEKLLITSAHNSYMFYEFGFSKECTSFKIYWSEMYKATNGIQMDNYYPGRFVLCKTFTSDWDDKVQTSSFPERNSTITLKSHRN